MSQLPYDEQYQYQEQYQCWSLIRYDFTSQNWVFKNWMPRGWSPPTPGTASSTPSTSQNATDPSSSTLNQLETATQQTPLLSINGTASDPTPHTKPSQHAHLQAHRKDSGHNQPSSQGISSNAHSFAHFGLDSQGHYQQANSSHQPSTGNPAPAFLIAGTYPPTLGESSYESLDPAFYVRGRSFFHIGKAFAVVFSEPVGSTTRSYENNSSISEVKWRGHLVHTQVRRFIVVQQQREFCYACPIFTYGNRGTTKRGVAAQEHAIAYSWGHQPYLLPGETGITMPAISIVMTEKERTLQSASRINFGIHYPIQYNVKVKDLGYVPQMEVPRLIANWKSVCEGHNVAIEPQPKYRTPSPLHAAQINSTGDRNEDSRGHSNEDNKIDHNQKDTMDGHGEVSQSEQSTNEEQQGIDELTKSMRELYSVDGLQLATNPKGFFKKGRVFMTIWAQPKGASTEAFIETARFIVVKTNTSFSVCLRMSTYSGQATTKPGVISAHHVAAVHDGGIFTPHPLGEQLDKKPVMIRIEDPAMTIDPMSRINFAKPYTIEHNILVRNIGCVMGDSIGMLDTHFAESLGYTKS